MCSSDLEGLLLLGCGESTIRLCPPLVIGELEAATALAILDAGLCDLKSEYGRRTTPALTVLQPDACAGAGI